MTTTIVELDHSGLPLKSTDVLYPRQHVSSMLEESEVGRWVINKLENVDGQCVVTCTVPLH